jgi:thioredoxin reductase (NADPH)
MNDYDVVIVGAGPAGLTAGLYTARAGLSSQVIEKALIGGQITYAETVENYPGFVSGISGLELTQLMHEQATKYGLETLMAEVTGIEPIDKQRKIVRTSDGDFAAKAVIITAGSARRRLDVPGEAEFTGRGVSYCATCDGAFFRNKVVAVVGGGNVAITEALHLNRFAQRIIVIHRRDKLRAGPILQEKAFSQPKIEFQWDSVVEKIRGSDFVTGLDFHQVKTRKPIKLPVDASLSPSV